MRIEEVSQKYYDYVFDIIKQRWKIGDEECENYLKSYLSKRNGDNCFIALDNYNDPVGVGVFNADNDVGVDLHPWCGLLWVEPDKRGSGIGYQLTLKRFERARIVTGKQIGRAHV